MGYILVCSIHLKSLCLSLSLEKKKREKRGEAPWRIVEPLRASRDKAKKLTIITID